MNSNRETSNSFLPQTEEGDRDGTGDARDVIPLGKYKRSPSIPIDMLEQNRSSPSVIELDILRRKRQQEAQLEMLNRRDFFINETFIPTDTHASSQYINRIGPILRFQKSPPSLHPFARKSLKSGLLLPMRRNLLSPPKILVGRAIGRSDDRLSEMMTSAPDSDDFLLRFPMTDEENSNFYVDLDSDDTENHYTDDLGKQCRVGIESQDDLFIPSSSPGFESLREEVLRCRSTSPVTETGSAKYKITLKPKLRNTMNSLTHASQDDLLSSRRRRDSPPNLSALNLSNATPIKPRVRHPQNLSEVSSNLLLNALNIETSSMDIAKRSYFRNETSPFRLVIDKNCLHVNNEGLFHSSFAPQPPLSYDNTPSYQNTPFYSYDFSSGASNPLTHLVGAESTWRLDSKIENGTHGVTYASSDSSAMKMSFEGTPANRTTTSWKVPTQGCFLSQPMSEKDNTPN